MNEKDKILIDGYEKDTLRELQLFLVDMMKSIDEICEKYGVRYFVIWGTAIGAIRHQGFIPWDDDIDLGMLLEDHMRLVQIPKAEWDERGLELITANDYYPSHLMMITRVYKKGTVFENKKRLKYDKRSSFPEFPLRPIGIDIFVYTHIDSPDVAQKMSKRMSLYQKMYWRANTGMKIIKTDPISYQLRCVRNDLLHNLLCIARDPQMKIYKRYRKELEKLDSNGGKYITTFESEFDGETIKSVSLETDMFPLIKIPFENIYIYIQKNYEDMLTSLYGNYLELPPADKRINHAPGILDFGDGRGNVIREVRE